MRTGEYKVKFNYTILRGFIDAFGLIMAGIMFYKKKKKNINISDNIRILLSDGASDNGAE